jgi:hypothetical protein
MLLRLAGQFIVVSATLAVPAGRAIGITCA